MKTVANDDPPRQPALSRLIGEERVSFDRRGERGTKMQVVYKDRLLQRRTHADVYGPGDSALRHSRALSAGPLPSPTYVLVSRFD